MAHPTITNDMKALLELVGVAQAILEKPQTRAYERMMRYLAISLVNSSASVATLCDAGHGMDAVKIARSMFEIHVTFKYLLVRPEELRDFLDFDAVARYQRLQFWKTKMPDMYARFPKEKIEAANSAYQTNKGRFLNRNGKVLDRWCRHGLAEMARIAGLEMFYDVFYRHASTLHHSDPIGLAMLIDGRTLEIQPGPTARYIGLPVRIATSILHDVLTHYSRLVGIDSSDALKRIDELLGKPIDVQGDFLGSLAEAFPPDSEDPTDT